jgi:hypothetical protein
MLIELSTLEMQLATRLGTLRQEENVTNKVREQMRAGKNKHATELHILGAVAEIGFAKWQNIFPDLSTTSRSKTCDFIIDGKRYDIKARPAGRDWLICNITKKLEDADFYIHAVVNGNKVNFAGWAYAHELINPATIEDIPVGNKMVPTYVLKGNLHKFKCDTSIPHAV